MEWTRTEASVIIPAAGPPEEVAKMANGERVKFPHKHAVASSNPACG